ncbi:hypothetical protein VP1G_11125 [Cytospora mali]|uniref:Uncharacterized protein n=1 Tax=Cytospora mali TaxID=578113 RepID=A0A194V5E9_CYTMA|nr:hypothetical protein VP1G_11125 [Valsa mali var. pyri (nom. inval.)]
MLKQLMQTCLENRNRKIAGRATRTAPLTILGHADGHPTFLVLFDANPAPRLLNPLHLLLEQHQLSAAEPLGLDEFAVAVAFGPDEVTLAVALSVKLPLEIPDLMTDITV